MDLKVMTFNVRQMDGEDGDHAWEHRKDALIETIALHKPALLGTQETFPEQTAYILEHLPEYSSFGRGRYGDDRDKHCKIFYDRAQFQLLQSGEIWMSMTPDIPGSLAWDIPKPRMISWGRLRSLHGPELLIMNTHFPYGRTADEARRQAARLLLEKLEAVEPTLPVLVTGDFNAQAEGEIYQQLTQSLRDAWPDAQEQTGPTGTVHGFGRFTGGRIDWILYRGDFQVLSSETITHTRQGLYPSDHFPVTAVLRWKV